MPKSGTCRKRKVSSNWSSGVHTVSGSTTPQTGMESSVFRHPLPDCSMVAPPRAVSSPTIILRRIFRDRMALVLVERFYPRNAEFNFQPVPSEPGSPPEGHLPPSPDRHSAKGPSTQSGPSKEQKSSAPRMLPPSPVRMHPPNCAIRPPLSTRPTIRFARLPRRFTILTLQGSVVGSVCPFRLAVKAGPSHSFGQKMLIPTLNDCKRPYRGFFFPNMPAEPRSTTLANPIPPHYSTISIGCPRGLESPFFPPIQFSA